MQDSPWIAGIVKCASASSLSYSLASSSPILAINLSTSSPCSRAAAMLAAALLLSLRLPLICCLAKFQTPLLVM